ncbi:MAG: MFS transporter [Verrucomicrobiae bacterium]|nr:MFS transporter [Verrucomicrobiae bacterium]
MQNSNHPKPLTVRDALRDFWRSFTDLGVLPGALWIVIGVYVVESMAYFGVLTLMTHYLSNDLHWGDKAAGVAVSAFTMLVTLFMLGVGSWAEKQGLRRAILLALGFSAVGRLAYCLAPWTSWSTVLVFTSILLVAMGSGILTPSCYSGVKQFTNEKTHSMGYAMIYAWMNLGIVGIGALSAWIRPAVQEMMDGKGQGTPLPFLGFLRDISVSGAHAVNWVCLGITLLAGVGFWLFMTRRQEAARLRPETDITPKVRRTFREFLRHYFTEGPFANPRFLFFIFMLLPVRTLFAHQWLTMPEYILRAYPQNVADRMEWLVNWINPLIIFFGVPILTALTRRVPVYTMMVIGTLVSAAPTFLLCAGPHLGLLIIYFVIFSIGEALWSARFLEYAAELAPPGRVAQFMGLANIPWLLAKGTTGLYSGYMLETFCTKGLPPEQLHTEWIWLIYGCFAMSTPVGLWLARKWVAAGLQTKH